MERTMSPEKSSWYEVMMTQGLMRYSATTERWRLSSDRALPSLTSSQPMAMATNSCAICRKSRRLIIRDPPCCPAIPRRRFFACGRLRDCIPPPGGTPGRNRTDRQIRRKPPRR